MEVISGADVRRRCTSVRASQQKPEVERATQSQETIKMECELPMGSDPPAGTAMEKVTVEEPPNQKEKCEVVATELPKKLWVASTAYNSRERVWHQVEDAGWDVPIETWTSVCGWPFSRNLSKVILNSQLNITQRKCKKCLKRTCGEAREAGVASSK